MAILLLCAIALPFSVTTAFASTNVTNESINQTNATTATNATSATVANTTQSNSTATNSQQTNATTATNAANTIKSNDTTTNSQQTNVTATNAANTSTANTTQSNSTTNNTTTNYNSTEAAGSASVSTSTKTQTLTSNQINEAANRVQNFVETNNRLPNYVTINGIQYSMTDFLYLLTSDMTGLSSVNITPGSVTSPPNQSGDYTAGNILKSEYLTIAANIQSFIKSTGRAPNYASSSLGNIDFSNLVNMFTNIAAFEYSNARLPNYVSVSTNALGAAGSSNSLPAWTAAYLQPTTNCQSNDPKIIALANSITSGLTSSYDKASAIFNWVDNYLTYSYYYNSQEGALGALASGTANCCDTANLLIAIDRAAGLPAQYVHGNCYFYDDGWYGHVWAQVYVNGQWITEDAISSLNSLGVINNWDTSDATIYGQYINLGF